MKKIIVAAMIALGSLAATAAPSFAETVIITRDRGHHPRGDYRPAPRHWEHVREMRRDRARCRTKTVRIYREGRAITRTTRVCR